MNEKAGTFRAPGGGLNPLAGVIPSLESAVVALKTPGGEKAYKEFVKAAGKAKDASVEYYTKVAKKVQENAGYVEKEYARLTKLIAKGGLSAEKADDLVRRSNILKVFKGQEEVVEEDEEKSEL